MYKKPEAPSADKVNHMNEMQITKFHRQYRILANDMVHSKRTKARMRVLRKKIEQTQKERKLINVQLNVAMGTTHVRNYKMRLQEIELHAQCQDNLQKLVDRVKTHIQHLEMQIKKVDQEKVRLSKGSITEQQYYANIAEAHKQLEIVENRLDTSKRRECQMIAKNRTLRYTIDHMLHSRDIFNKEWKKLVSTLNKDKFFLLDLCERAMLAYNKGSDICAKLDALNESIRRDNKAHTTEMNDLIRKLDADVKTKLFLSVKGQYRELCDLEPREIARRNMFREFHNSKINSYNSILAKIKNFYQVEDVDKLIEKFTYHEEQFFSHFNYINELNHQVELLHICSNYLYNDIDRIDAENQRKNNKENEELERLKTDLAAEQAKTEQKEKELLDYRGYIFSLLETVTQICRELQCDDSKLLSLLGDHTQVTQFNLEQFLTILDNRLTKVLVSVYYEDRERVATLKPGQPMPIPVVKSVKHDKTQPTDIRDLVQVTQCSECAEGEDVNRYDEEIVYPLVTEDIREKVKEKVVAPEIQYRLHTISKCRLPHSRNIVNKRYL